MCCTSWGKLSWSDFTYDVCVRCDREREREGVCVFVCVRERGGERV